MAKAKGDTKKEKNDTKARGIGKDHKKPMTESARGPSHATGGMKKGKHLKK
jgi:hypothetical protein